jgi:hypothetical protein
VWTAANGMLTHYGMICHIGLFCHHLGQTGGGNDDPQSHRGPAQRSFSGLILMGSAVEHHDSGRKDSSGLGPGPQDVAEQRLAQGELSRIADQMEARLVHHVSVSDAGVRIGESERAAQSGRSERAVR